jgi:hypothetical protein
MKTNKPKKFDDWSDVRDCNGCEHYWNNTCDAPVDASKLRCNDFSPTRGVIIPEQIKTLQSEIKRLKIGITLLCISFIMLCVMLLSMVWGC